VEEFARESEQGKGYLSCRDKKWQF